MLKSILHVLRFRGAPNALLNSADKLITQLILWLALIILPMQVYRNFVVDPTPLALPLLACSALVLLVCTPVVRVQPKTRLTLISSLLIVFALLVQARNPNTIFGAFHISTAAIIALLLGAGTRAALFGTLVNAIGVALLVSRPEGASSIQITSLTVGYSASIIIITGSLAGLFQAYAVSEARYWKAREQIDQVNDDRDNLLQSITLELRNPVATLRSLTYNANMPSGLAQDLREVTKDLNEAIDDLRYNLSPDSIAAAITLSDCHLVNLLAAVRRQVEPLMAERSIRLQLGSVRLPVTTYRLDTSKLRAIVTTLLRQIAQGDGVKQVEISVYSEDIGAGLHRIYIELNNDGSTLSDDTAEQIFGPNRSTRDAGFNLSEEARSLTRLRGWLDSMGGTLHFEKVSAKGSRFVVAMHVAPAALHADGELERQPVFNTDAMATLRVAILEQDRLLGRAATTLLKNLGAASVDLYPDAQEFLREFRGGRFYNMVLMDQRFRDISGLDVLAELRGDRFDNPIIILDSSPNEQTAQINRDQGATVTAGKPLSLEALAEAFRVAAPQTLTSAARVMSQFR